MSEGKKKDGKRMRRDAPEREGPVRQRNFAGVVPPMQDMAHRVEHIVTDGMKTAQRVVEAATEPLMGAVERGVHTAYVVIDEYIARGRDAAQRYQSPSVGNPYMSDNRQGANPWGMWGSMAPMMGPMMAPWMQMAKMWTDSMSAFVPGGAAAMNQFMAGMGGAPMRTNSARHSVQVSSRLPATVSVSLDPDAEFMLLKVEPLAEAKGTTGPSLTDVTLESVNGHLTVRVTVPDTQPAGTYAGPVLDGGGNRRGEITVQLAPIGG